MAILGDYGPDEGFMYHAMRFAFHVGPDVKGTIFLGLTSDSDGTFLQSADANGPLPIPIDGFVNAEIAIQTGACCTNAGCTDQRSAYECEQLLNDVFKPDVDCGGDSDSDGVPDACDVCPDLDDAQYAPSCIEPVPTVGTWGLVILAVGLLAAGKVTRGFRQGRSATR